MTQTGEEARRTPLPGEEAGRAPILEPPARRPSPYERFVRVGIVAWCGIGVIILGYLMLRLLLYVNPVLPPLLIAVAVVYLLNPLVSALERRVCPGWPGGIIYVLFPLHHGPGRLPARPPGDQADHTGDRPFPDYLADAQATVRRVAARFGQEPDFRLDAEQVRQWLSRARTARWRPGT